ncbi:MAG: hypothetical protein N5P05_001274 [Chroococcopsis gigantea SAG 12.99]|nr:hypothetical protein [Chroococcopsis gigantea SAG 12.99]
MSSSPMDSLNHPILEESFRIIDREVGDHNLNSSEYSIVRRIIHTTADFEFLDLFRHAHDGIEAGIGAIGAGKTDYYRCNDGEAGYKNF